MARSTAPRSRRERPAKPPLSRDAIVAAALEIARTEGVEALSMRRVAQALDTGAASLYVYVADRQELQELVFDAAIGTIELPAIEPERWREQLKELRRRPTPASSCRSTSPRSPTRRASTAPSTRTPSTSSARSRGWPSASRRSTPSAFRRWPRSR